MIEIDGAMGEGGGQILRTSLTLAAMFEEPLCIRNIRANRNPPGLKRQHLTAARAVAEICDGKLIGDILGSDTLEFKPGEIHGGDYHFSVGTAGSAVLVAQTVIPVLLYAKEPSTILIEGGTHIQGAPTFEFFNEVYLPQLRLMGFQVEAVLERYGFFPAGGGAIRLSIEPGGEYKPYWMVKTGALESAEVVVLYSGIDPKIAKDEADIMAFKIQELNPIITIREVDSICSGNAAYIRLKYENITEICSAIGAIDRSRKHVANDAAHRCKKYLKAGLPVGPYLADQVLLPMLHHARYGRFSTVPWSSHSKTNLSVLSAFPNHFMWATRPVPNGLEFEANDECSVLFTEAATRRFVELSATPNPEPPQRENTYEMD